MARRTSPNFVWNAWLAATAIVATCPSVGHGLDEPGAVWQLLDSGATARMLACERIAGGARNGDRCERFVVSAPAGQSVHLGCGVAHTAVLDELEVRLWVKASQSHVQLAARVVLPRARQSSGERVTAIVRGPVYRQPGHWQQLVLKQVPKLLAAEVRALRTVPGARVDAREAFLEGVVLLIPGEPQGVEVVTDELEVDGVRISSDALQPAGYEASTGGTQEKMTLPTVHVQSATSEARSESLSQVQGSILLVNGRPFMPRAIRWQGEPFEMLANCGFNTVQLFSEPTAEQIAQAQRAELWFLCAPPRPDEIRRRGLGQLGDRVLAWYLDDGALDGDRQYVRSWIGLIRQHDAIAGRPVILPVNAQSQTAGKLSDVGAAYHPRIAQMLPHEYGKWLAATLAANEPGVPTIAHLPTQWGERAREQAAVLAESSERALAVDGAQLEALIEAACSHGISGFAFESHSPLDGDDPASRCRALTLELINRRLQLIEPWLSAGKVVGRVSSADSACVGIMLHVDHARLLILDKVKLNGGPDAAVTASNTATGDIVFVVPGIPESSRAYSLSSVAIRPILSQRVAGGTRVVLRAEDRDCHVLLTEDPAVIHGFRQRIARDGPRFARLELALANLRAGIASQTQQRLAVLSASDGRMQRQIAEIASELRNVDIMLSSGRGEAAYQNAASLAASLSEVTNEQRRALGMTSALISHPLGLCADQLADYAEFSQRFVALQGGENLLFGGDFEDLREMTQFGWQHVGHAASGVDAGAKLSSRNARHGTYCLELFSAARPAESQALARGPAVWIVSPPVPIEEGNVVEISGWVRIDQSIAGSVDGLAIFDSLGGSELSIAARSTAGWQPFQIIRGAPTSTELRLTFVLSGIGSAAIDGVTVRAFQPVAARRLPAVSPMDRSAINQTDAGPVFVAPATR